MKTTNHMQFLMIFSAKIWKGFTSFIAIVLGQKACDFFISEIVKVSGMIGLFINIAHKVLVATKDGDETAIVELADFVASLKSAKEAST